MFAHTRIKTEENFAQRFKEERINLKKKQDERKQDKMLEIEVQRKVFKNSSKSRGFVGKTVALASEGRRIKSSVKLNFLKV